MTTAHPSAPQTHRTAGMTTIFLIAGVAISAGVPGLLAFDSTGLTRAHGLFNVSSLWRLGVFGTTALVVAVLFLLWNTLAFSRRPQAGTGFTGLALYAAFLGWIAFTSALALNGGDYGLAYYRMFEWVLTAVVVWGFLAVEPGSQVRRLELLVRAVSLTALLVIVAMWIVVPSVAHAQSSGPLDLRLGLGGSAFHPNQLAVVLGLGAIYWWATGKGPVRYAIALAMFACCVLTGSRSGIVGCAGACVAFAVLGIRGRTWIDQFVLRAGVVVLVCAFVLLLLPEILQLMSRESADDLRTLNSRTNVWQAALALTERSPWIGHGFILGPRLIGTSFQFGWWLPTNAQNDVLNAAVAGGIPAAIVLSAIYVTLALRAFRARKHHPLLSVSAIPVVAFGLLEPNLSSEATLTAVLTIGLMMTLAIADAGSRLKGPEFTP